MFLTRSRLSMSGLFVIGVLLMLVLLLTPNAAVVAQEVETDLDTAEIEPLLDSYCYDALLEYSDPMTDAAVRFSAHAVIWLDGQCNLFVAPSVDLMDDAAVRYSSDAARWLAGDYEVQGFAPAPYDTNIANDEASIRFTAEVIDLMGITATSYSSDANDPAVVYDRHWAELHGDFGHLDDANDANDPAMVYDSHWAELHGDYGHLANANDDAAYDIQWFVLHGDLRHR